MNVGSVVQIGGAVRHTPLPLLIPQHEPDIDIDESRSSYPKSATVSFLGGFIGGGQLAWRAAGPTIEIIDPYTCTQQAAWTFGAILRNNNAKITCVCGIGVDTISHVVVGIDLGSDHNHKGMVGILSLRRSRITRAFQFRQKVTNVCMVTGGDKIVDPSTLSPELRSCQGLLAVSTGHAGLYLVDLALDLGADKITSDEVSPALFTDIIVPDPDAVFNRNEIISKRRHPILCLSNTFSSDGNFKLLGPDDNVLFEAPSHSVNISSLLYIPQLASLIIGYSFGTFQIINLSLITIDCATPYEENLPPVFAFTYQEPENDPRSFVYLWVCRSLSNNDSSGDVLVNTYADKASCSLYAMNYEKREWIEGHGLWYQCLQSMSLRFDFEASATIAQNFLSSTPTKIFSAMTVLGASKVTGASSPLAIAAADMMASSDEEADPVPELSLCMFCWEGSYLDQGNQVTQHYIAIFDINQWYQAQMPSSLRIDDNSLCPYMSFHTMDKVPKSLDEKLLSAASKMGSLSRYSCKSTNENTWFPSSLSYELHLLTSEGLVTYRCPSVQQSVISSLMQQGPGAIVNPNSAFNACVFAGIMPSDYISNAPGSSTVSERKHLLDIALEQNLISLIIQCIIEFSEGRFSHVGCSLELLLDWAWDKVRIIKESYDNLCIPLFSFGCGGPSVLSDSSLTLLHQHLIHLTQLCTIINNIKDNAGQVTHTSAGELEARVQVVNLLKLYLQAVLWFYHCGLLPQCEPDDQLDGKVVPFPEEALHKIYENRRSELKKLSKDEDNLLLIDGIVNDGGSLLEEVWGMEGENVNCYPPSSIHSLLSMYLLPKMSTNAKNRIIQYLFLDLASLLSDNFISVVEELVQFPSSFSMSPSIIKLTQAFWLIDQKDFETGLSVLLDPLVNPEDVTPAQHRIIIKALLLQGQENHALTYTQLRQPPEVNLQDIQLNLTVLLANGRIREAFHYQRNHRVDSNAKDLLHHLFLGCQELGRLESIVHLPLSPMEEQMFIQYLKVCGNAGAQDILLIYYLQQSRFTEIATINDGFRNASTSLGHNTRAALVDGYLSHLPSIRLQMKYPPVPKPSKRIYTKPLPLSAKIRHNNSIGVSPFSKARRFAIQEQNEARERNVSVPPFTPFRSKVQRRKAIKDWTEDIGLVFNRDSRSQAESQGNSSRLVFPTTENESIVNDESVSDLINFHLETSSSAKQNFVPNKEISSLQGEISKVMEDILRKTLTCHKSIDIHKASFISADMVSLLKTPPVTKRRSVSREPCVDIAPETPQSILKVRKILQRSHSPVEEIDSPIVTIPTFPLQRSLIKSMTNEKKNLDASMTISESGSLTPKLLRFDLPSKRLSVDCDNAIVLEPATPIKELSLDKSDKLQLKRKWSDTISPNSSTLGDQPTPRKPLPNFTPVKVSHQSYGLSEDQTESQQSSSLEIDESVPTEVTSTDTQTAVEEPSKQIDSTDEVVDFDVIEPKVPIQISEQEEPAEVKVHEENHIPATGMNHVHNYSSLSMTKSSKSNLRQIQNFKETSSPVITDETVEAAKNIIINLFNEKVCSPTNKSTSLALEKDEDADSACEESFHSVDEEAFSIGQKGKTSLNLEEGSENETERLFELTKAVEDRARKTSETLSLCHLYDISRVESDNQQKVTAIDDHDTQQFSNTEVYMNGEDVSSNETRDSALSEEKESSEISHEATQDSDIEVMDLPATEDKINSKYLLTFSDSEDDSENELIKVNNNIGISRADTLIMGSNEIKNGPVSIKNRLESSSRTISNLPSVFENIPSMFLTTKENQVVESVLKEKDMLVNTYEFKKITKPTYTPTKSKNIDNIECHLTTENIPVLIFSDDDENDDISSQIKEIPNKPVSKIKETPLHAIENDTLIETKEDKKETTDYEENSCSTHSSEMKDKTCSTVITETIVDNVVENKLPTPITETKEKTRFTNTTAANIDNLFTQLNESEILTKEKQLFIEINESQSEDASLREETFADILSVTEVLNKNETLEGEVPNSCMDVSSNNNNLKKVESLSEELILLTPLRRSRRLSGMSSGTPADEVATPLRRSRRLSGATTPLKQTNEQQSQLGESTKKGTPSRRNNLNSSINTENTPIKDSAVQSESLLQIMTPSSSDRILITPLKEAAASSPWKKRIPMSFDEEKSETFDEETKTIGIEEIRATLLKEAISTPNRETTVTPSRKGINKRISELTPKKVDTPIRETNVTPSRKGTNKRISELTPKKADTPRRSSRISAKLVDSLEPILETNGEPVSESPVAKKTPTKSARRRSINLTMETIDEISELSNKGSNLELSPLSNTATPTVRSARRGASLEPTTPQSSGRRKLQRKKSASVTPTKLGKIIESPLPRRRRNSEIIDTSECDSPSKETRKDNYLFVPDSQPSILPEELIKETRTRARRSTMAKTEIVRHLSVIKDAELSIDLTPVNKRVHRRKETADDESIIIIKSSRKKTNAQETCEDSEDDVFEESQPNQFQSSPTTHDADTKSSTKKYYSPVKYNLLELPAEDSADGGSIDFDLKNNMKKTIFKRKKRTFSIPLNSPESVSDEEDRHTSVKKRKISSSSKTTSTKALIDDTVLVITRKSNRKR